MNSLLLLAAHEVGTGTTVLFGLLLVAMILGLAFEEKLHAKKSIITGLAALVCLFLASNLGVMPRDHDGLVELQPAAEEPAAEEGAKTEGAKTEGAKTEGAKTEGAKTEGAKAGGAKGEGAHEPAAAEKHKVSLAHWVLGIEWGVIGIILGASLFVDVSSKSGMFTWVAVKLTKQTRGDPLYLLLAYGGLTVLFSAFLNNVTAMIIVGSLTAVSLKRLGQEGLLMGFLLMEGLLTNVGGLLTLISSVPNIIVGQAARISFMEFFLIAAPYVVASTAATLFLGMKMFQIHRLEDEAARKSASELVSGFDENDGIQSRGFFYFSIAAFVAFILALATKDLNPLTRHIDLGFIALGFGALMLLIYKHEVDKFYAAVDWDLLAFFATLFVVINVMEHAQVLAYMGKLVAWLIGVGGKLALLWSAAAFSSVTDNIPLSAMLAKILQAQHTEQSYKVMEWWAVVFGSNLGGNMTPIGSASTVVAVTIMAKHKVPLSFVEFVKKAMPFALLQLGIASIYLLILGAIL
ncbi:MAG: SLC13 family permease [Planctomycetota bacterium]